MYISFKPYPYTSDRPTQRKICVVCLCQMKLRYARTDPSAILSFPSLAADSVRSWKYTRSGTSCRTWGCTHCRQPNCRRSISVWCAATLSPTSASTNTCALAEKVCLTSSPLPLPLPSPPVCLIERPAQYSYLREVLYFSCQNSGLELLPLAS